MGFEDREWYRKEQKRKARAANKLPRRFTAWHIVLAMLAVAALLFAGLAWIVHSRAEAAAELKIRSTPNVLQQSRLEGQKLLQEAGERDAARKARVQQQDAQRLQAADAQQRAAEEGRLAQTEAEDRKAKAWEKFYRKPAVCNDATTMACANAFIRAKREFEEKYGRGEL